MSRKVFATILVTSALLFATRCNISPFSLAPTPTDIRTPLVAFATTPEPTETPSPRPTPTLPKSVGKVQRDITFCAMDGVALKLDLYYPSTVDVKPLPVLINLHGGSWSAGDKQHSDTAVDIPVLVERGYVVAGVDYRHAPTYKFPAQIQDAKCAVRFLRANAARLNLDPNRIGAWGCSAGGHLVSLLAVADKSVGWDNVGEYKDQSSRIQAVAPLCAPSDITLYDVVARSDMLKRVFGSDTGINPNLLRASPVTFVTKDDPPFLIFQGDKDSIISLQHGKELYAKLTTVGVSVKLITVKNGTHCFPPEPGMSPTREEVSTMIADFFDQVLKR